MTHDTAVHGTISYFEIPAADAEQAKTFYADLFGWTFSPGNAPGYAMIDGGGTQAGLAGADASTSPRLFFTVEDMDAARARVTHLGGTAAEPIAIPAGRFARCTDDQGVTFTLWEDAS
ncbi:VOC family protein [Euzebya tangerina]|uniref:VOC family protein n=1 Tax=Euzebya tangerina TaxID=591198 RepID=UPI000E31E0CD|nr:VOC family protein [Euzebya tangerina]